MIRHKPWLIFTLTLGLLVLLTSASLAAPRKSLEQPFSITDLQTSLAINPLTYLPIEPTDTFTEEAEAIYLTFRYKNAQPESTLKVEWFYVPGQLVLDDFAGQISGSNNAYVYITRPDGGWASGEYRALIYYNNKLHTETTFQVQATEPTQPTSFQLQPSKGEPVSPYSVISEYSLTKEIDPDDYRPTLPTNRFIPSQPYLYLSISTHEAPADSLIQIEWYYVGVETFVFAEQELDIEGTDTAYFRLSKPDEGWPLGMYKVAIYFNEELYDTLPFTIVQETPYDYIQTVCMTYDVDDETFEPVDVTYLFFASDPEIHVLISFEDVPKETPFFVRWYYYEDGVRYQVAETPTTGSGDDTIDFWVSAPEGGFWLGDYEAEVYIDGELYTTIPFTVVKL